MPPLVKFQDIVDELSFQSDEASSHLNTVTGEVVCITDEALRAAEEEKPLDQCPDWMHDMLRTAKDVLETDHYLPLPTTFDIHEYRIMERFCYSVEDQAMRDDLCRAIGGRGAFRYFKDKIHDYGLAEAWYRYRDEALREIAIAWCEANGIPYTD
jgi:hypothetical protein